MQMISPEMWVKSKNRKILRVNLMLRFDVCELSWNVPIIYKVAPRNMKDRNNNSYI
jgi:hypothetical protein